ncbi:insulinase family protein [Pedobacter sp. SD-b]|uniref:Insulinase family protein n=1 Tax=Pedobacter segetis TaxID=2793069 RepID=A0ABS1BLZ8_9SPHI|nr:pitrilysin family protein [Pedobacter segetis]MBK0383766.1 insulinase family protein [Pedobacter segetis]
MIKKIITALLLVASTQLYAQNKVDDVKAFTLKNGMKFLVLEDASIPNANMYLFYNVGSRNEHPGITGLSHFFEHMMFNGAKKYGPKMFDRTMEFNGGANNAYTTENVTVYTDWFPSKALETIFDLESDRIENLSIDPKYVKSEREVVLSERRTGLENSPWRTLGEQVSATAFQEHPYHWSVIGYEEDIKNWTKEDLENYFKTYYAPNNCTVVISGNIKLADVKRLAEKYMAPIPAQKPGPKVHLVEPPQTGERRITVKKEVNAPYMIVAYHVPNSKDKDYYALDILSSILTGGNSSRLYHSLVDENQLATSVFSDYRASFDPTLFEIYASANKGKSTDSIENAIYKVIDQIAKDGITDKELEKTKNQKLMSFYRSIETIDGKSNSLGTYELFFGDYKRMFSAPDEYAKVTKEDVKRVANQYFKKSNRTVGILKSNVEE